MPRKEIRILVDGHALDGEFQGTRSYIAGLYQAVLRHGARIRIFLGARHPDNVAKLFRECSSGIEILRYRSNSSLARLALELPLMASTTGAHFGHFQYVGPLIKNCKWIVTIHDLLFLEFPRWFPRLYSLSRAPLFRRSARRADILLVDSQYTARQVMRLCSLRPERIRVLPVGVDKRFLDPPNRVQAKAMIRERYGIEDYVLCVSRIEPRKGQHLLLQWLGKISESGPQVTCVLVGKRSLPYAQFESEVALLRCGSRGDAENNLKVVQIEQFPEADLVSLYAGARLVVYPSLAEGFGIPPLEAAGLGCPVLCSNRTAMSEYSFFEQDHVDPLNSEQVLARITSLLVHGNTTALEQRSEIIRARYNWDTIAGDFIKCLMER